MSRASTESMRYITLLEQGGYICWWVRVGLATKYCCQETFIFHEYGGKLKALQAAKIYRDNQEIKLNQKYGLRFELGWNPSKKSVYLTCNIKPSGKYWNWTAQYYDVNKKKQYKKTFSINKYGTRMARKLAIQWRDLKRTGILHD